MRAEIVYNSITPNRAKGSGNMESSTIICNCKQVTFGAIEKAMHEAERLNDAIQVFDEVQKATNCSTGCGRCHDKILDVIADLMYER